jgi:hypothetical protein
MYSRNYSEQELNMDNFLQDEEYDKNMHEKFKYLNMHMCL